MSPATINMPVGERGSYCENLVPESTYAQKHWCEKKVGLKKYGRRFLCLWHRPKGDIK